MAQARDLYLKVTRVSFSEHGWINSRSTSSTVLMGWHHGGESPKEGVFKRCLRFFSRRTNKIGWALEVVTWTRYHECLPPQKLLVSGNTIVACFVNTLHPSGVCWALLCGASALTQPQWRLCSVWLRGKYAIHVSL